MKEFQQATVMYLYSCMLAFLIIPQCLAKPGGDYSTLSGDYGATDIISGAYQQPLLQDTPSLITTGPADLKQAGTYGIPYGTPHEPIYPIFPVGKFGGWGGGWKPPHPIYAPFQIIAKPVPYPISAIPFGWGWQGPGLFP